MVRKVGKLRPPICTVARKFKNKAGMFMITKPLPFFESPESWNVYENRIVIR
jgi:hypothetical protein